MSRFFCPGRVELAGNYTDLHKGRVMAAAIDKGITAEAEPNGENVIRVYSQGFEPVEMELEKLWPEENDAGSSASLVRGMAGILAERLLVLRGFDAYLTSDLVPGSGLGSSAAYAVILGFMISHFADGEDIPPLEIARAAQKAETRFFGRQCSGMDQLTCAMGGGVYLDFLENKVLPVNCDFDSLGLALCHTGTGGFDADAAKPAAAIVADMSAVAQSFGEPFLARVRIADFDAAWPEHSGELAWMRARHFFDENWRVTAMTDALGLQDAGRYLELMNQSGRSSETLLQNVECPECGPALSRGLKASARILDGRGAWRVHGNGFAGHVQALMPESMFPRYQSIMDEIFGERSCRRIHIYNGDVGLIE